MPNSKNDLRLAKVALFESRMAEQLSALVRKHGGTPYCAPAVKEAPRDASNDVAALVEGLATRRIEFVVIQTGASVDELERTAARIGRREELLNGLRSSITICRGPKPIAALRRLGVDPKLTVPAPYTTVDLLGVLEATPLDDAGICILHHGEKNALLTHHLEARSRAVSEIVLYEWELPEPIGPLERLIRGVADGDFDAVAFTSQVQVRNVFAVAGRMGLALRLTEAMQRHVVVAAVGPTCAAELTAKGVRPDVVPDPPKMGHMVFALAQHMSARTGSPFAGAVAG